MYPYNNKELKSNRRKLRRDQTDVEKIIWGKIRNRAIEEVRFLRQYSIGNYILDFYSPALRLAIELDGGQHNESANKAKDLIKDEFMESNNIKVLRFWNNEVAENLDGVLEKIRQEIISVKGHF